MAGDGLGGVLGEVVPQVPAVSDLHRVRRALAGAFGISAGPVAADHPRAGVGLEPAGQRAGLPAGQDVDRPPGGGVDQDGRADVPCAQREVVGAEHFRRCADLAIGQAGDHPQQRVAVHHDAQRPSQAGPGPPGQLQRDLRQ